MAITVTASNPVPFRSVDNITKYSFLFTAGAGELADGATSVEFSIPVTARGKLVGVDFMSDSTNLTLSLRTKMGIITTPSIFEIYSANAMIASTVQDLSIFFSNDDVLFDITNLYVVFKNNAGGGVTNNITLFLYISTM